MSDKELADTLAGRFAEEPQLSRDVAARLARSLSERDDDVRDVARFWLRTGHWPDSPLLDGYTPRMLATMYEPSQVLKMLSELRNEPESARATIAMSLEGVDQGW